MRSCSCLLFLLLFIGAVGQPSLAQDPKKLDSLHLLLSASKPDTNRVKLYFSLTWETLKSRSELATARSYVDSARQLSEKLGYPYGSVMTNFYYGVIGRFEGNYRQALDHLQTFTDYFEEKGDSLRIATALYQMAVIYSYQGQYEKSLKTYLRILRIHETDENHYMIATTLNSIGIIHKNLNNYARALENYLQALPIFDSLDAKINQADCLHNIGNIHALKKDYAQALEYYKRSLAIDEELANQWGIAYQLESIGSVYMESGNYREALSNHLRALEIREELGQKKEIAASLVNVGNTFYLVGNFSSATDYLNRAAALANEIGSKPDLRDAYYHLSQAYAKNGAFAEAYLYQRQYLEMKDSILNEEMARQINELQTLYETEKKEQEIQLLSQQQQIQKAEILQQKTLKNAFIAGVLLLMLLVVVLVWNYRQKLKSREMIARKNDEINRQKIVELEKTQKLYALDAMISGQEVERKRIAQDLHDGLGALLSTVQMQFSRIEQEMNKLQELDVYTKANALLDEACREVRKIAHNMMPGTLLKLGLAPALKDLCDRMNETHAFEIHFQSFGLEERLSETMEITVYRLVQEALNNIVKHARASEVIVQLSKDEETLHITIEDDGIGFSVPEAFANGGMGMKNLDSRVKYLNGELEINSEIGKGTTISVEIPLLK